MLSMYFEIVFCCDKPLGQTLVFCCLFCVFPKFSAFCHQNGRMHRLEWLDLNGNSLTDLGIMSLSKALCDPKSQLKCLDPSFVEWRLKRFFSRCLRRNDVFVGLFGLWRYE